MIDFTNVPKHMAKRGNIGMKPVLMHPEAAAPATHYYMIRGGVEQKNITVWEPGTVGGEYIKTFGHIHVGDISETYWVLYGQGVVLLQKLSVDDPTIVEEFKAITVKPGDSVHIESGWGHGVSNTGSTYLVTADDSPVNFDDVDPASLPGHADYSVIENMRGFAYYVVEQNGQPVLTKNPNYKEVRSIDAGGLATI